MAVALPFYHGSLPPSASALASVNMLSYELIIRFGVNKNGIPPSLNGFEKYEEKPLQDS